MALVIADLPRSQFHAFKLKPNLKPVDFLKSNATACAYHQGLVNALDISCLQKGWFVTDLPSWGLTVLQHSCRSWGCPCPGAPWAALHCVCCPTLTKQAAKACLRVCKPTLTAALSITLTPQRGKKSPGHLQFPGSPGGLASPDLTLASLGKRKPNFFF